MNDIVIEFPVKGEWITPNTPGSRIPSHGTELFGETYAIDFVMIENGKKKAYDKSLLEYLIFGVDLKNCYGWGQNIHSPVNGVVTAIENSVSERNKVHPRSDYNYLKKITKKFINGNETIASVAGNHVIIRYSDKVYVLLAHLKKASVCVEVGQKVTADQVVGQLGHSGNSMMPHLHMQLMTDADYKKAEGIPFVFREYEVKKRNGWETVRSAVPRKEEIIRNK